MVQQASDEPAFARSVTPAPGPLEDYASALDELFGKRNQLEPHIAAQGLVFGRSDFGIDDNDVLVAAFRTNIGSLRKELPGFEVIRVNLGTQEVTGFLKNVSGKPASVTTGGGLERPIALEWAPDGSLYVVDFGVINVTQTGLKTEKNTATIWKLSKTQ